MRILSVVGARPQFIKLAPIDHALRRSNERPEHVIVHTGQHYDEDMSDVFFRGLDIAPPDVNLHVGSASHGRQTGRMLSAIDECLENFEPDVVLVYGDTNSTLAAALSAVKMHIPVAHLEAGLRSWNRRMPEEHNRILTDHASDLCLAPTPLAMVNLEREGLHTRSVLVGDVMTDICLKVAATSQPRDTNSFVPVDESYFLATIHRADNTDDPDRLRAIIDALDALPSPVVLTAHPRLVERTSRFGISLERANLRLHPPLDYRSLIAALAGARGLITDSGGLQKEAFLVRTPCTTVRTETEWTETLELGWNVLAGSPDEIMRSATRPRPTDVSASPYGDGHAAERVVEALLTHEF